MKLLAGSAVLFALISYAAAAALNGPKVGGFSQVGEHDSEEAAETRRLVLKVARDALAERMGEASAAGGRAGCDVEILEVDNFEQQVVAGMMYKLSFTAGCSRAPGSNSVSAATPRMKCVDVRVFQPLTYACPPAMRTPSNPRCLEVQGEMEEYCRAAAP